MKAIKTKYIGPSNVRGSRISASDCDGNRIILWDGALDSENNHRIAANALKNKMHWNGNLIGGHLDDCMVWVFTE